VRYYVLDINPEPWAIGDVGISRRSGKLIPFVGPNRQLQFYKEAVKEALNKQNPSCLSGAVRLRFFFWRRLDSYKGGSKNRADATNMQKATEDACQGILFANDRDVTDIQSVLVQAGPEVHGAVVIGIEGDNGLNLLEELGDVVMDRLRALNENKPPESDNAWITGTEDEPF
jgi:Holliday junction resolvase RusA-like endonuclease